MPKLKPEEQACFEAARRVVCGDRGEVQVHEDGTFLVKGAAFKLEPSRDPIDALIVAIAKAMQAHLRGVEFGKLRHDLVAAGMGEQAADFVHDHLVSFSVEDWAQVRDRVGFYAELNARMRGAETTDEGTIQ